MCGIKPKSTSDSGMQTIAATDCLVSSVSSVSSISPLSFPSLSQSSAMPSASSGHYGSLSVDYGGLLLARLLHSPPPPSTVYSFSVGGLMKALKKKSSTNDNNTPIRIIIMMILFSQACRGIQSDFWCAAVLRSPNLDLITPTCSLKVRYG